MKKSYVVILLCVLFVAASAFVIWFSITATQQTQEIRGQAYGTSGGGDNGGGNNGGGNNGGGNNGGGNNGGGNTCSEAPVNVQFRKWSGQDTPWVAGNQVTLNVGDYVDVNCFAKNGAALLTNGNLTATVTVGNKTETVALPNPDPDGGAQIRKLAIAKAGRYTFTCKNSNNSCSDTDQFTVANSLSCKRGGCSGQLCLDSRIQDMVTTCEFKPEYACYQAAECKVQADGNCGFTPSDTLTACLNNAKVSPTPTASVAPSSSPAATPGTCANGNYAASDLNKDCRTDIQDFTLFLTEYRAQTGL